MVYLKVPVLGPLLFLTYIIDLHNLVKYSDIHHFADDTNLLYASKSIKDINRKVNFDLKNIIHWLMANKISLDADMTKLILFQSKNKVITKARFKKICWFAITWVCFFQAHPAGLKKKIEMEKLALILIYNIFVTKKIIFRNEHLKNFLIPMFFVDPVRKPTYF